MPALSRRRFIQSCAAALAAASARPSSAASVAPGKRPPNFIFILTDDQRHDALGCAGPAARTPNMDALAARGTRFSHAFVTTSICSPSRAACLTGLYGSSSGIMGVSGKHMQWNPKNRTFAHAMKAAGYKTGFVGKWHISGLKPAEAGLDEWTYFVSNGPHTNREVVTPAGPVRAPGFIEDYNSAWAVRFMEAAGDAPFCLHLCTQVPHMTLDFTWKPSAESLALFDPAAMPMPASLADDLAGKPPYLAGTRSRAQAAGYGYPAEAAVRRDWRLYLAAVHDTDRALGAVFAALDRLGLAGNTYVVLIGDNGWFMGEHGFTSKVLAYEESIRVPLIVAGPGVRRGVCDRLVLNADLAPTLLELAGLPPHERVHGRSLAPLLRGEDAAWRDAIYYEALAPELGTRPLEAVRDARWKYIRTYVSADKVVTPAAADSRAAADQQAAADSPAIFEELYDLAADPGEMRNLASDPAHAADLARLRAALARLRPPRLP